MTSEQAGEALVKEGARKITDKDVEQVVNKADAIKNKFGAEGPLARFIEDARLLTAVVKDYWAGTYRQIPYGSIGAIVFTLAYVLNPLDLIPDVIPVLGQVDDAMVFGACLLLVEHDLHNYKKWKLDTGENTITTI